MTREIQAYESRPAEFLAAWKAGVALIGPGCFHVTAPSVSDATDRDQLRPNFELIGDALLAMSGGQRRFMIALCQFYSDSGIAEICRDVGIDPPSLADIALIDDQHRSVLLRLIESYTGW